MKDILITQDKIKTWEKEKATLEAHIKADHERLSLLNRRLENLSLYVEQADQIQPSESLQVELLPSTTQNLSDLRPPAAVETILKTVDRPITASEIKTELKRANYPVNKFGKSFGYLYSVLGRMIESGRIAKVDEKYKLI